MTVSKPALISSTYRILIDGVEIPHQGFSILCGQDTISTTRITIEPDLEAIELRPSMMVHIFVKSNTPDSVANSDLRAYTLFWEGEVTGVSQSRGPGSLALVVEAASILQTVANTKVMSAGPLQDGSIVTAPIITGTVVDPIGVLNTIGTNSPLSNLGYLIGTLGDQDAPYSDVVRTVILHYCKFNAVFRQQVIRTRLLNKITSIPDSIKENLVVQRLVVLLIQQLGNSQTDFSTVFSIIQWILDFAFSHVSQGYHPATTERIQQAVESLATSNSEDTYPIPIEYRRHDVLAHGETYFLPPPPCNLILPPFIQSLSWSRDFSNEPTRQVLSDPFGVAPYTLYLAPSSILRQKQEVPDTLITAATLFSALHKEAKISEDTESPYVISTGETSGDRLNALALVSFEELEKGVIVRSVAPGYEVLSALGRDQPDSGHNETDRYLTDVLEYLYNRDRSARTLTIQLIGHRWLVPGFPVLIYSTPVSFTGVPTQINFTVDPSGVESTSVTLEHIYELYGSEVDSGFNKLLLDLEEYANIPRGIVEVAPPVPDNNEEPSDDSDIKTSTEEAFSGLGRLANEVLIDTALLSYIKYLNSRTSPTLVPQAELPASPSPQELAETFDEIDSFLDQVRAYVFALDRIIDRQIDVTAELASVLGELSEVRHSFYDLQSNRADESDQEVYAKKAQAGTRIFKYIQGNPLSQVRTAVLERIDQVGAPSASVGAGDLTENQTFEASNYLSDSISEFGTNYRVPLPPNFLSPELTSLTGLDSLYGSVLGCLPLYSAGPAKALVDSQLTPQIERVNKLAEKLTSVHGSDPRLPQQLARLRHMASYLAAKKILNAVLSLSGDGADRSLLSSFREADVSGLSEHEWIETTFLRRRVLSLQRFLIENKLTLSGSNVQLNGPSKQFWVFTPETDNSILDRIVDEKIILNPNATPDPIITELKEKMPAAMKYLVRRDKLLKYAERHFNRRGFSGQ